jgi:hypothetical protein
MKILPLDLGKFNGVSCLYNTENQATAAPCSFFTATRFYPSAQRWPRQRPTLGTRTR